MGKFDSQPPKYWNYYLTLEADVANLSRYVEFTADNFETYSMEMVKIFLSACSEVDVIAKQLCQAYKRDSKASHIGHYRQVLVSRLEMLPRTEVRIPRYGLSLVPWISWEDNSSPNWWQDHNAVKHQRHDAYKLANLGNVLDSMAGLLALIYFFNVRTNNGAYLYPETSLFYMREFSFQGLDY